MHKLTSIACVTVLAALPIAACSSNNKPAVPSSTTSAPVDPRLAEAPKAYATWVRSEVELLMTGTRDFANAYIAGDNEKAKSLYAPTRAHWERIEPVAETFGDLDPKTDAREADLKPGETWTGWHLLEKDLWQPAGYVPLSSADRTKYANQLVS